MKSRKSIAFVLADIMSRFDASTRLFEDEVARLITDPTKAARLRVEWLEAKSRICQVSAELGSAAIKAEAGPRSSHAG